MMADMQVVSTPDRLPASLESLLDGYSWSSVGGGLSGAAVFQLKAEGRHALFVKVEKRGVLGELSAEASRLIWLASTGLPCPAVLGWSEERDSSWLVMTALRGQDLSSSRSQEPEQIIAIAADALAMLHRVDPASCPFDLRIAKRLAAARMRVGAGLVNEADFDEERQDIRAADLLEKAMQTIPIDEDLVVTHGDACLPNLIAADGVFSGFVDVGCLGVADRHQDLALAVRDIGFDLGQCWVEPFLGRYGRIAEPNKLAFYQLVDEFF